MKDKKLPSYFASVMWSYDLKKLNPDHDKRAIIVQTIKHGQWKHLAVDQSSVW